MLPYATLCFLFAPELTQAFPVHWWWILPHLLGFFPFSCLEEVVREDTPTVLASLPSRAVSQRILLSRSLKKLKPALCLGLRFCYVSCTLISVVETLPSHGCCSQGYPQPSHSWPVLPVSESWLQQSIFPCYLIDYLEGTVLKTLQESPGFATLITLRKSSSKSPELWIACTQPHCSSRAVRLKSPMCTSACIHQALFSWVQINLLLIDIILPTSRAVPWYCYYLYKRLIYRLHWSCSRKGLHTIRVAPSSRDSGSK